MTDLSTVLDAIEAHDMGRWWRLVSVEGGRVTGTFWVSMKGDEGHVRTVDVVVWHDEQHSSGQCLYSDDLTAFVHGGVVDVPPHMITEDKRPDVLDVMADMEAAILAAVEAANAAVTGEVGSRGE